MQARKKFHTIVFGCEVAKRDDFPALRIAIRRLKIQAFHGNGVVLGKVLLAEFFVTGTAQKP